MASLSKCIKHEPRFDMQVLFWCLLLTISTCFASTFEHDNPSNRAVQGRLSPAFDSRNFPVYPLRRRQSSSKFYRHGLRHARLEEAALNNVQGVCVFDIDRTLTASQQGGCATGKTQSGVNDPAYGGGQMPLVEAGYAEEAIRQCIARGFGVSIATHGHGCKQMLLDGSSSKFQWVASLVDRGTGGNSPSSPFAAESWSNMAEAPAAFQCGSVTKDLMMQRVAEYWGVFYHQIVFFDDQQSNIDAVEGRDTNPVHSQLVSTSRGDTDCRTLTGHCCGVSYAEFEHGMQAVGAATTSSSIFATSTAAVTTIARPDPTTTATSHTATTPEAAPAQPVDEAPSNDSVEDPGRGVVDDDEDAGTSQDEDGSAKSQATSSDDSEDGSHVDGGESDVTSATGSSTDDSAGSQSSGGGSPNEDTRGSVPGPASTLECRYALITAVCISIILPLI